MWYSAYSSLIGIVLVQYVDSLCEEAIPHSLSFSHQGAKAFLWPQKREETIARMAEVLYDLPGFGTASFVVDGFQVREFNANDALSWSHPPLQGPSVLICAVPEPGCDVSCQDILNGTGVEIF